MAQEASDKAWDQLPEDSQNLSSKLNYVEHPYSKTMRNDVHYRLTRYRVALESYDVRKPMRQYSLASIVALHAIFASVAKHGRRGLSLNHIQKVELRTLPGKSAGILGWKCIRQGL
jgi:hypothetical protein